MSACQVNTYIQYVYAHTDVQLNFSCFSDRFPRAQVPKRLPLNYARGEVLVSLLDPYLRAALQKGVPPLFTDILSLYDDPERIKIIENLMYGYLKNLKETGHLCDTGEN